MPYARRLILHAPHGDAPALAEFVEACLRDGVVLVCVVGDDCERVEETIDALVVGDGSEDRRFLTTTAHPNESLDAVRRFAAMWTRDVVPAELVEEVRLPG